MIRPIAFVILLALVITPTFAHAQGLSACSQISGKGLSGVVECIVGFINSAIGLLIAGAVLFIVYGAFNMIRSEEKREEGKKTIYYGIIGLFVMISIWGLVNILSNTFGGLSNQGPIQPKPLVPKIPQS